MHKNDHPNAQEVQTKAGVKKVQYLQ
jgi:hypothetical protein